MNYVLLPYQARILEDKARVRVIEKSRRIGVSWALAGECVLAAATAGGQDQWYIGYDAEMAQEFVRDAAEWSRRLNAQASQVDEFLFDDDAGEDGKRAILAYRIRFASGCRISGLSSSPRNFRSRQGHAIIDEAAFHDDLDEVLKAAMAFLIWGGRVTLVSTHDGDENTFAKLCDDVRAGRRPFSLHTIPFHQAVSEGLYDRICEMQGKAPTDKGRDEWVKGIYDEYGDDASEELDCIPGKGHGAYIAKPLIEACSHPAPVARLDLDDGFALLPDEERRAHVEAWCQGELAGLLDGLPDLPHHYGQDFGRVSDLSVIAPVTYAQDTRRVVPFLVELRNCPYQEQEQIMRYVCDRLPSLDTAWFDATGNGGYLAERALQAYGGDVVTCVKLSQSWYAEWLPRFRDGFESSLISVPRDADVVRDLTMIRRKNGVPCIPDAKQRDIGAQARGRRKATRHADSAIALALAYCGSLGHHVAAGAIDGEREAAIDGIGGDTWDVFR